MKRSALLVGAFVLVALALVVTSIVWLGGRHLFEQRVHALVLVPGSAKGLYVGAPVTFRGVQIGQVDSITIEVDPKTLAARIPARVLLRPKVLQLQASPNGEVPDIQELVRRGLRARLVYESLVTGQVQIDLDFVPEAPPAPPPSQTVAVEIPAIKSELEGFVEQVGQLPLKDTLEDLRTTLQTMNETLKVSQQVITNGGQEWALTAQAARVTMTDGSRALASAQRELETTMASLRTLSATTHATVQQAQPEILQALQATRQAAQSAQAGMDRLAEMTAPGAPQREDLETSLRDLSQAARSLRQLSELLEQQPNAIIFGKP